MASTISVYFCLLEPNIWNASSCTTFLSDQSPVVSTHCSLCHSTDSGDLPGSPAVYSFDLACPGNI